MNQEVKKSLLEYINNVLTLKGWHDIGEVILFKDNISNRSKELEGYLEDLSILDEMKNNPKLKLLIETLLSYEKALRDDWLPNSIEGLSIPKAYLFLKEIKDILETDILDNDIKKELIKRYHIIDESES